MPKGERFSREQVREYWSTQARQHGTSPAASWTDTEAIGLEVREILSHLRDGEAVLDIGCANGYSTLQYAERKRIRIRGLDFIPEMIESARRHCDGIRAGLLGEATFDVGDITALKEASGEYDRVIVTRVLINMGDHDTQVLALRECARVLRPGGVLLLSEASLQGWTNLNRFRAEWGLPPVPMPSFNLYIDEARLFSEVADVLTLSSVSSFSSTYFVGTRVFKPLLAMSAPNSPNPANPDMEWNRFFARLPSVGDYGTQKLFLLSRRS